MSHHAELDWSEGLPASTRFGDVYFSCASGLAETRHVFLDNNRLPERFAALTAGDTFTVAETGFGTGLNFLAAWQCFAEHAPSGARLAFVSVEKYPLTPADLERALALWPELAEFAAPLLEQYDWLSPGWHRFVFDNGRVTLTLAVGDALSMYPQLDMRSSHGVDAWFLDGFAPSKNPEMWQQPLFDQMARLAAPRATFATFTSAGAVRRGLTVAGFAVRKVAGYGHKREMSVGELTEKPESGWQAPWYAPPVPPAVKTALVIGGGLAGASTAHSLAIRGWQVTLLERHGALAQEASGNPQGVLYTKLSAHFTPLTQLVLSGYGYSLRTLAKLLPQGEAWQRCGVLQLAQDADTAAKQTKLAEAGLPTEVLRTIDAAEASALAGIALSDGGLWFGQGGWVNPPALVNALASHPNIRVLTHAGVLKLKRSNDEWCALGVQGELARAPVAVLASAADTRAFDATADLPLKRIRGQVSVTPATAESLSLKTVLCGEGYVSPAREEAHCFGASFKFDSDDLSTNVEEHRENLAMLAELAPSLYDALGGAALDPAVLTGRAAFRCTSPDYLPIIGPVARSEALATTYRELGNDAKAQPDTACPYEPGLYANAAHGSRGLITAPLSGEILAAQLNGEVAPIGAALMDAVHPNRFAIRRMMRRQG
ncbi:bifunctional tRNA (5-methylaminomethyl-2-thiouridine)(34)-methyltransferase MnmD/FAD-dependent 5-carboxymethylaminomethyl-2-thiouridine(34) oxidoreductase MnmC [Crenobacter sp. SG2303]|uniref:tRNA 5-methylaminomethyl-2-thiouridine biosynthesis bifunctional protein MnmC n=1 Tax=Crenobacter oryzisoli TaxID=3056844 RepID=A0ABT7XKH9_9NEIS|nr:bifunctional tRNA (5-methylaminomethyl-2-thiouridine)(34)-methyltransferase MnmD/FAD-dependent 5-carboxymethylaminomethyl-2-thiouridine(34) oxidoreductase MnmC [Crenobacter sp. SG2303]MDN0074296.1 bifunctional tRNA (5-methylaminomethyl-2-thiouridine)(34)-methyltransferase MnmD/FAD-dependent 5-carboxymethylaminomethyl-2-thiouridine(34) oxidoreductase MnmC [Crenobacter sp. SG2303]